MVVLSSSLFQSVLDRMADEAPETEDDDIPSASVRGLKSGFVADIGKSISNSCRGRVGLSRPGFHQGNGAGADA